LFFTYKPLIVCIFLLSLVFIIHLTLPIVLIGIIKPSPYAVKMFLINKNATKQEFISCYVATEPPKIIIKCLMY